jgi:NAD(P)-dependent dehydrogenase (short-subunit alcohol dehydrogenase family)
VHSAAARSGVVNMTKTLAYEWAPYQIRVNAIAPGNIDSEGIEQYDQEHLLEYIQKVPQKRMGSVEEVAQAVAYLCSPAAGFITGTTLELDGGEHLAGAMMQL